MNDRVRVNNAVPTNPNSIAAAENADATVIETYANEGGESLYLTKEYKLEGGKTYYLYGNGTKLNFYYLGLDY